MRRMSPGRTGLIAALEEEELQNDAPEITPEEVEGAGAENTETELLDVNDEEAEAQQDEEQVEEAAETAEALEAIAVSLESAAANGGLDKHAAHAVGIALDHMYKRVGFVGVKSMPALESFGQGSSRIGATQIALEDIKSKIAEIWEAIKSAIKKAIAWLEERFTKIFGAANKLEKRAQALIKRAGSTSGNAKEKSFKNARLVKALAVGGQVSNTARHADELRKAAEGVLSPNNKRAEAIAEIIDDGKVTDAVKEFTKAGHNPGFHQEVVGNPEAAGFGQQPGGLALVRSQEFPGGQAIIMRAPESIETNDLTATADVLANFTAYIGQFDPKAKAPTKEDVQVLSISDCQQIAKAVEEIAVDIQRFKAGLKKGQDAKARILKGIDKLQKESVSEEDEGKKKEYKALQKLSSHVVKLIDQPATAFSVYALNTGKSLCDYVELSLKQYAAAK